MKTSRPRRPLAPATEGLKPRRFAASLMVLILSALAVGCGGDRGGTAESAVEPRTYDVRGVVRSLPSPDRPGSELMVRHEAVPDFEDIRGEAVGMDAMTMGFPVADEALLEGIAPGDTVAFTLRVHWDGSPPVEITALEKLPEGTELTF